VDPLLQQMIDAGLVDDRADVLAQQIRRGQGMMQTPGAQGMNVGGTYKAASPLEHAASAMARIMGGRMVKGAEQEYAKGIETKRAGRLAMGEQIAGLPAAPDASALLAGGPDAEAATASMRDAIARRRSLGAVGALSGDPVVAGAAQRVGAEAQGLGQTLLQAPKSQAEIEETRARTAKLGQEAGALQRKNEPATPAIREFAGRLGIRVPETATNSEVQEMVDPFLRNAGLQVDWAKLGLEREKATHEKPKSASGLRAEFQGSKPAKDMSEVATSWEKIRGSSPTGAGDVALIFAFMKMLDPGSTVREGEFAQAASTGAVPDRVLHFYKRLDGDKLPPSARAQLKQEAERVYKAQRSRYDAAAAQYRRLAEQQGISPGDVVLDMYGQSEGPPDLIGEAAELTKGPARISSDADYEALPSGAQFVDPEGNLRRKP
jgi:hypothetical protein